MSANRVGAPQWHIIEIHAQRLGKESESQSDTGEIKIQLIPRQFEDSIQLGLKVEAEVPDLVRYIVHIAGQWGKSEEGELSEQEFKDFALGYRLDELAAAVNFELAQLAARLGTAAPYVPQEQLELLRREASANITE